MVISHLKTKDDGPMPKNKPEMFQMYLNITKSDKIWVSGDDGLDLVGGIKTNVGRSVDSLAEGDRGSNFVCYSEENDGSKGGVVCGNFEDEKEAEPESEGAEMLLHFAFKDDSV